MQLSRAIGFFYGNVFLLSSMIGSGILVSPKGILKFCSMNIPLSLGIWAASAILIMMYALCVAEIATTFPVSAASYYFLKRSFGPCVAFLSLWIRLFAYPLGLAAQCLISSSYLIQPFYVGCSAPELPKKCLALAILWSLGILNARGMTTLSWFQSVSSLMKMAFLSFISLTGIVLLVTGKKENVAKFENALDAELPDVSHIIEAFLQGFYAYYGYTVLTNLAGEVKNPSKTIPRSVISALSIVAVIYLLTNISFLAVLTPQEIISSDTVAISWIDRVIPSMQWAVSLEISVSAYGSTCCAILSTSRILYSASQERQLPLIYSMLNENSCPVVAVIQIIILSSIAIISSNFIYLVKYMGLMSWWLSTLNIIGLLKLRYQEPDLHRPYKVWLPFVFGSLALCFFLLIVPMIHSPSTEHIYEGIFLLSGLLCYWLHILLKQHSVRFDTVICYLQLLFNVCPPEDQDQGIFAEKH